MSKFIQLHILTAYPPSNLNRDDLGRPKTAIMGGSTRLRISSQSLKRAWRTSEVFAEHCGNSLGVRTKAMGLEIHKVFIDAGIDEKSAKEWAMSIAGCFGKNKAADKKNPLKELEIEQLAHFSPEEKDAIATLQATLIREKRPPNEEDLKLLRKENTAVDIAMFGRMLASNPAFNCEAAVQVAHAITVHEVAVEDDFFTAVDDLNKGGEDLGAGHMGEVEFGSGLFYHYLCINHDLLLENLNGDAQLAASGLRALVEAATRVAPTGKQNSFGSRAYAEYLLAEKGKQQPRSLAAAYLEPVRGKAIRTTAVAALESFRDNMDKVYGTCTDECRVFNVARGEGSLADVLNFVTE
ncbi:MAG: type I-E CRISPR-associated protein Cas7/Cse4/CasC [Ignavibacteriae bacterium]|nr:type I-E CRISPR-associated protein Cas7/Cse4/CasC [Ignavibacteriota bacterium]